MFTIHSSFSNFLTIIIVYFLHSQVAVITVLEMILSHYIDKTVQQCTQDRQTDTHTHTHTHTITQSIQHTYFQVWS